MNKLEEVEKALFELPAADQAMLMQRVAHGLVRTFPGIDVNPDVCGGEPCIVRTRIPVWLLVQARRLGASEAVLLHSYPTLRAADLVNAWSYAQEHQEEIDRQIRDNEEVV